MEQEILEKYETLRFTADKIFTANSHQSMKVIERHLLFNGYEIYDERFSRRFYINEDLSTAIIFMRYKNDSVEWGD